jgi:hypothetical protein
MLFDLLALRVSEMLRSHHVSSLMDDHDQIVTYLAHLSSDPMTFGSHASDPMAQICFPHVLTSRCSNLDFNGPDHIATSGFRILVAPIYDSSIVQSCEN